MIKKSRMTEAIHVGEGASPHATPLTTPIFESATFVFETAEEVRRQAEGRSEKFVYSRHGNPTVMALEAKVAVLEGAEAGLAVSSGMAAVATAIISLVTAGDEVVCSSAIYGGTLHFLTELMSKFQVRARFVSIDELRDPARVLGDRTRLLWFESPINPTLRCVDIRTIAGACQAAGVISVIDNTFATPVNQRPISMGVDVVMHSATKYLNGHSDLTAGMLVGAAARIAQIKQTRKMLGTVIDPRAAYSIARGVKTLAVRVERQNASAMAIARFLERDRRVQQVFYPGLEGHPDHAIARQQMTAYGGMVCLELGGGMERAARFFDRLQVFKRAASLGGVESLCSLPVLTSQYGWTDEELQRAGVTTGMARLSVGLEDVEDLIADLDQALN